MIDAMEAAMNAAGRAMGLSVPAVGTNEGDTSRKYMRIAIAAFLRAWKPSDLAIQQAVHWHDRAVSGIDGGDPRVAALVHAAMATADELDPPREEIDEREKLGL